MEIINVKVGSPSQSTNVDIENPSQVKAEIKNITINTDGSSKAVLYYPQELTSEQKQQARANIDAASQKDLQDGVNEALKEAKESGDFNGKDATVKIGTLSDLKELPELKIYQVTQEEYNDSYEAGTLDPNAVYVTPDSEYLTVSAIVDNLTTSDSTKVLSAKQGVAIKTLIDALQTAVDEKLDEVTSDDITTALGYTPANKADIATTKYIASSSSAVTYAKISDFGEWGTGVWYQKGFSMLITSRAGEMIWVSLAANDSDTSANAIRLIDRYGKIQALHYSPSESAIYATLSAWANNICAHILSNVNGDYVPTVASASALPSDAVQIPITPFGVDRTNTWVGHSSKKLNLNGSDERPLYNSNSLALQSDIPTVPSNTETWEFTLEDGSTVNKVVYVG